VEFSEVLSQLAKIIENLDVVLAQISHKRGKPTAFFRKMRSYFALLDIRVVLCFPSQNNIEF
jgi:fructose-bisphosphate aldolase class 1